MNKPIILSYSFVLVIIVTGSPNIAKADRVDDYVRAEMKKEHIPGLELGVYKNGKIAKAQGYGLANIELSVPVKPDTIFQSGSIGKQFLATAVMMLVEENKIRLGDSVLKYFPNANRTWSDITVQNLLSHTSGLAEYESDDMTGPDDPFYLRLDFTEDELLRKVAELKTTFSAGEDWNYCNTNYLLLGFLIRRVSGEFYGDFLRNRIFNRLGMTNTRVISEADIIPNRAAGYRVVNDELKNQEWVSPTFDSTADGTLYFNVLDLAKWDAALYTEKLVKRSSLQQMWTIAKLNNGDLNQGKYGFGWYIRQIDGHPVVEHDGDWQGFTAFIARYVDSKVTVVVLTNLDAKHCRADTIAHNVGTFYVP